MGTYHRVVQGEHLSSIAKKYGFSSYKTIWDHGQNAELKKKRQNPNVIFQGDELFIPDKGEREESRNTENKHRFELKKEKLKLRLVLEDVYDRRLANTKCELHLEGEVKQLTTDGQGRIEQDIKPEAERALLLIKDPKARVNEILIPINIGHLDPVEETSGQAQRLNNLGYFAGPIAENSPEDNRMMLRSAVEEFQCDHGLKVDGVCGPVTRAKLKEVHGS